MISLDIASLKEINGGNQASYEAGQAVGEFIRKWALVITLFTFAAL